MTLFDEPYLNQVEENAAEVWMAAALDAIEEICMIRPVFTTDDVWPRMDGYETHDNRAMGAAMRKAAKNGWCVPTDRTMKTNRASAHKRPVRVWRSNLFR